MYYSIFTVFYTSVSESCSDVILRSEALPVIVDHITNSNRNKVTLNKAKIAINILFNLSMWPAICRRMLDYHSSMVQVLIDIMIKVHATYLDVYLIALQTLLNICRQNCNHIQKMPNLKGLTKKLISMNDQIKKKASSKPATELQQNVLSLMKQLLLLIPC